MQWGALVPWEGAPWLQQGVRGRARELGQHCRVGWGGIPLLPAAPHTLTSPWREVSISECAACQHWAEAAPGYPHTLAANCVWDYASKSCQPEPFLILLGRRARGFRLSVQGCSS